MSVMPGHMTKRPVLDRIDKLSKDKPKFDAAIIALDALDPYVSADDLIKYGKNHGLISTTNAAEENHLKNHWFTNWWPQCQPTPPLIRRGLLKAFELSQTYAVPLDCYWCCAGHAFEFVAMRSDQQITVIITTPPPPSQYPTSFPDMEDIWMVKTEKPEDGELVESDLNGIYTVQLRTDDTLP
jgi:hypothetical protein